MEPVTMANRPSTNSFDTDLSPTTIAAAAMAAAVANRERLTQRTDGERDNDAVSKLFTADREEEPTENSIAKIWNEGDIEANLEETLRLLISEIDAMVQSGLGAFHELDVANRQLIQSKELVETKAREAVRMNAAEDQSRASLSVR
jgi:hypothetical protein